MAAPAGGAVGRYGTDKAGYGEMLKAGRNFDERIWAVEGCNGIGKHFAHRLVHDGDSHPQVIGGRQHRVRPTPPGKELQIDIQQRHPEPDNRLAGWAARTDQTRIQHRHLRNLLLDTQPATTAGQNVHQDHVHNKQ